MSIKKKGLDLNTLITHVGNSPAEHHGFVNVPVYRGSTVVFPSVDSMRNGKQKYGYGRWSNPSTEALVDAIKVLEGAEEAVLTPSGLSACTTAILACVGSGEHLLVPDSIYGPTRHFCETTAKRLGIQTTYYDPLIGSGIKDLIKANTRAIFTESPGSHTFEIQDIPAITAIAYQNDVLVITDNTWATPINFKPLAAGSDISIMAATKYIVGHSDVLLGTVAAGPRAASLVKDFHFQFGIHTSPDDVTLALRGLRTLPVRLNMHESSALKVATWLEGRDEVLRVLHPGLPSHPQHDLWRRDFKGSTGLFSFITQEASYEAVEALLDDLSLFSLGYSWGGYESLAMTVDPQTLRTATTWDSPGHLVRLHIGLESPEDLIEDLRQGLERFSRFL